MKRVMTIEAALQWAYCEELPKDQRRAEAGPSSFAPGFMSCKRAGEMGTVIDDPNIHGVLPDPFARQEPHPDAVIIGEAVRRICAIDHTFDDWEPLPDLEGDEVRRLGAYAVTRALLRLTARNADGSMRLAFNPDRLIIKHAVLGGCPDWVLDAPEMHYQLGANGKPGWFIRTVIGEGREAQEIEVDGMDRKRRIPLPGAYQKPYLDPDPTETAVQRGEYQVWWVTLQALADDLSDRLETISVTPSPRSARPWDGSEVERRPGVVLRDLTEAQHMPVNRRRRRLQRA